MATFTPPTTLDGLPSGAANRVPPYDLESTVAQARLFRHIRPPDRSPNLYRLMDGTYTTVQPDDETPLLATYLGGHVTPITAQEVTDLTAAGYGAGITP